MAIQLQIKRGSFANMPTLAQGEFYFATDYNSLFVGLPDVGPGYIQIGDTTDVNSTLEQIRLLLEEMRIYLKAMAG